MIREERCEKLSAHFIVTCSHQVGSPRPPRPRWRAHPVCRYPHPPCPPVNCRLLVEIKRAYCCGCALPYDIIPQFVCPRLAQCPLQLRSLDLLCSHYNFLMNCCC